MDCHEHDIDWLRMRGSGRVVHGFQRINPADEASQRRLTGLHDFLGVGADQFDDGFDRRMCKSRIDRLPGIGERLGEHGIDIQVQSADCGANHMFQRQAHGLPHLAQDAAGTRYGIHRGLVQLATGKIGGFMSVCDHIGQVDHMRQLPSMFSHDFGPLPGRFLACGVTGLDKRLIPPLGVSLIGTPGKRGQLSGFHVESRGRQQTHQRLRVGGIRGDTQQGENIAYVRTLKQGGVSDGLYAQTFGAQCLLVVRHLPFATE